MWAFIWILGSERGEGGESAEREGKFRKRKKNEKWESLEKEKKKKNDNARDHHSYVNMHAQDPTDPNFKLGLLH